MSGERLQGKVGIVTGGGTRGEGVGNGRAAAVLFAREGAKVPVVDRDLEAAARTVGAIDLEGGVAAPFVADVARGSDAAEAAEAARTAYGRIDVVHNNVGIDGPGTVLETDEADWDAVWAVNTKSMMLMAKAVLPTMAGQHAGSIVNVSSISAIRPRGLTAYTVAKGAVIALTRGLAVDHGPQRASGSTAWRREPSTRRWWPGG